MYLRNGKGGMKIICNMG